MTKIITANIDRKFEVDGRCMSCNLKSFERLMEKFQLNNNERQHFFEIFNHVMARSGGQSNPEIYRTLSLEFCKIIGLDDPYFDEKKLSNAEALKLYDDWRMEVINGMNPFNIALRLSIAGNIMDFGADADFDIHKTIEKVMSSNFAIDHSIELEQSIKQAKNVLYLGDNAGEIVFDKLFIETFMHPHLTYAVRGGEALNDVLMLDAHDVGMELVADVISNGYNASSTILDKSSKEFLDVYKNADLIISKGQGNFEGLLDENDSRIFFLLMVKCDVIAEKIGVKKGSFVVYNQTIKTWN